MKHHCGSVQRQLTMTFGETESQPLAENLRRVLAHCPQCRNHYQQMTQSQAVLRSAAGQIGVLPAGSVWPALQKRLPAVRPAASQWVNLRQNVIPIFSTLAACLAVAIVLLDQPSESSRVFRTVETRNSRPSYLQLMPASQQTSLNSPLQQAQLPNWSIQQNFEQQAPGLMMPQSADFDEQSRLIEQEFQRRQQELLHEFLQRHPTLFSH